MTIEQCYEQLHGDYAQVIQRLPSPALVERFIGKFLDDGSFSELTSAMAAGQTEAAFRDRKCSPYPQGRECQPGI